jgi:hypothetical protein
MNLEAIQASRVASDSSREAPESLKNINGCQILFFSKKNTE